MRFLSNVAASALGFFIALALIVFFGFFFLFAITLSSDDTPRVKQGSLLVMNLSGPIPEVVSDDPIMRALGEGPTTDLRDLSAALEKAASDERIRGVWLQFEGVDASWATLEEVRAALKRFQKSDKPLLASSDDVGMSEKDYFLASTADSIFAAPRAPFEFNGFYTNVSFYKNALDRLNIEPQVVRAGSYKSAVEPLTREDLSPKNEEQLSALLGTQNQRFLQAIARSRNMNPDSLQRLTEEHAILNSEEALSEGLIDALRFRDEVLDGWRQRLDLEDGEEIPQSRLASYADVPASQAGLETGNEGTVAIVYAQGQIVSGESDESPFREAAFIGAETFGEAMRSVREDDDIAAVVLRVNSPGGAVAASDAMLRQVELTAREKPVVVSMGTYAASGGYWIATGADTIMADPLTITGSIGVFSVLFDASGLFEEELGITFDAVRTSSAADMFSGLQPLSDAERQLLKRSTEETYQAFLRNVAESRDMTVAQVDSVAQGRVWSGRDALRVGLVDTLGTLDDALALTARKVGLEAGTYRVRTFPRPKSFIERFTRGLNARAARAWTRFSTSPVERTLLKQRRFLRRLAREHGTLRARLPFDIWIE